MSLPFSNAMFVMAFERECTETFWEGHVRAFEFLKGVPRRISYDNTKVAVSQIIGGNERRLTQGFCQLKSHYLFDHHFRPLTATGAFMRCSKTEPSLSPSRAVVR
jgi:transposase